MQIIRSLSYQDNPDAKNRFARIDVDFDIDNDWEITLNGTDHNGDFVQPHFVAIDNYINNVDVNTAVDELATVVASFTKVILEINPFADILTLSGDSGQITVWISEKKLPIGEGINQHGGEVAVAANVIRVDNRAALAGLNTTTNKAAFLVEPGREGLFYFEATDHSAHVSADPYQGLVVAPAADATGTTGAWVRKYNDIPHFNWWGAKADYNGTTGTDNIQTMRNALTAIQSWATHEPDVGSVWYVGRSLSLKDGGRYYFSAPISIITTLEYLDLTGAELHFPANTKGIVINTDTSDDEATRASGPFPYRLRIIRPKLRGKNGTDLNKPGIWARTKFELVSPDIQNFSGDGIRIGNLNGQTAGNQDGWLITDAFCQSNGGDGIHAEGSDAQAGICINYLCNLNGRFAITDLSALGNSWNGQEAINGVLQAGVNTIPAFCHATDGHNYAIIKGQEANTNVNPAGGTRPDIWIDVGAYAGGDPAVPNWVSGMTMLAGGSICTIGGTGNVEFPHCYFESGQYSVGQLNQLTRVIDPTGGFFGIGGVTEYPLGSGIVNDSYYQVKNNKDITGTQYSYCQIGGSKTAANNGFNIFGALFSTDSGFTNWRWVLEGGYLKLRDGGGRQPLTLGAVSGKFYGWDLESGSPGYQYNGVKVLGAQISGTPAAATDLASALTLVNFLRSSFLTHGAIA